MSTIEFVGVSKTYPDGTRALQQLDLTIESGSCTVFVGPSGCGKTTAMRMINRMLEPSSGTVRLDGTDVSTVNPVRLRRGIGYVIQSGGLLPHRTVLDNIATVPVLSGESRPAARAAALRLLDRVGLDPTLAHRYPAQLSGGQQQRVGVARALAADPPLLLMDEPFGALDPVTRVEIQRQFLDLLRPLDKTALLVTHDVREALLLATRIGVLHNGRLVFLGGRAEFLKAQDPEVRAFHSCLDDHTIMRAP